MAGLDPATEINPQVLAAEIAARASGLPRTVPALRTLRREYSKRIKAAPPRNVIALAQSLLAARAVHRFVADELIAFHREAFASLDAERLELLGKGMSGWDEVDSFSSILAGPAWRAGQIGDEVITGWARSRDRWWRRAALVATTRLNDRGYPPDATRTLRICDLLLDDRDDMVVKAMSWALRTLAQRDPEAAWSYLEQHRTRLAARVVREMTDKLSTGLKTPRRNT